MIVIKKIEVIEVNKDTIEAFHYDPPNFMRSSRSKIIPPDITSEIIHGRIFVNASGKEICIGMAKQVQEAIGLPFEAYENMGNEIDEQRKTIIKIMTRNKDLETKLGQYEKMGFWGRIKFLFRGVIYREIIRAEMMLNLNQRNICIHNKTDQGKCPWVTNIYSSEYQEMLGRIGHLIAKANFRKEHDGCDPEESVGMWDGKYIHK